jgi:type IV secretion system protein VirB6
MVLFQFLGNTIEQILNKFVTTTSANLIAGLGGVALAATTLYFVVFGYLVIGGYIQNTFSEFVKRALVIALIVGAAFGAGAYQDTVVGTVKGLENGLSSLVFKGDASNIYQVLDKSFSKGIDLSEEAYNRANQYSLITSPGAVCGWLIRALIIMIATLLITVVAAGYILLAKIAISILLAIGPLFILSLMFPAVRRFFDAWAGQVVTYLLVIVLMAVVSTFSLGIFEHFVSKIDPTSSQNPISVAWQMLAITACLVIVALQVPSIASALGGGFGLSMLNPLTPAVSTYYGIKNTGREGLGIYRKGKDTYNSGKSKATKARNLFAKKGGSAGRYS